MVRGSGRRGGGGGADGEEFGAMRRASSPASPHGPLRELPVEEHDAEIEAALEELLLQLRCRVCNRAYRDPHRLPCGHYFCRCGRPSVCGGGAQAQLTSGKRGGGGRGEERRKGKE